jgi:hypothetical protein
MNDKIGDSMTNAEIDRKELRKFGVLVGVAFMIIGVWPIVWRGDSVRFWALGVGIVLAAAGLAVPGVLAPLFKVWMKIGHILGWINTRIILSIIFFGILTPMGLVMRAFGWDAMRRGLDKDATTYRVMRAPRSPTHMTRQF